MTGDHRSVADVDGPWLDSDWNSGLIQRCKQNWSTPICDLSDEMLATFLGQRIAVELVSTEARHRVIENRFDDSELYEGQLAALLKELGESAS